MIMGVVSMVAHAVHHHGHGGGASDGMGVLTVVMSSVTMVSRVACVTGIGCMVTSVFLMASMV